MAELRRWQATTQRQIHHHRPWEQRGLSGDDDGRSKLGFLFFFAAKITFYTWVHACFLHTPSVRWAVHPFAKIIYAVIMIGDGTMETYMQVFGQHVQCPPDWDVNPTRGMGMLLCA